MGRPTSCRTIICLAQPAPYVETIFSIPWPASNETIIAWKAVLFRLWCATRICYQKREWKTKFSMTFHLK